MEFEIQRRPNVSREKIEEIVRLANDPEITVSKIVEIVGSRNCTVNKILVDKGASYLSKISQFENETKEIRAMYLSGMSTTEIGKHFGVKDGAVRRRCRDLLNEIKAVSYTHLTLPTTPYV